MKFVKREDATMNGYAAVLTRLIVAITFCFCFALGGCVEKNAQKDAENDTGKDTEKDTEKNEGKSDIYEDAEADETELPQPEGAIEIIATTTARNCIGCKQVSFCGAPPTSDMRVVTMDAAPNSQSGLLFAAERWEAAGIAVPLETCQVFTDDTLKAVLYGPNGLTVLDGGTISLAGDMPLLEQSLVVDYTQATHNYSSVVTWPPTQDEWAEYYKKGVDIHVEAAGGSDLVAFSADALSPEPFDITSPHTDTDGKIQSISTDQPLEILWSGGSNFDNLVLILEAYYCPGSIAAINFMVMCHVENDGDFTIPAEHLSDLEWPNYVTLHMTMSQKVSLEVPEIEPDTAWSIRSISTVPIYENPDASPPPYNCESDFMEEGFVGNACLDDSECGSGCCLPEILDMYFYDNYCSITGCTSDNQCPTDAVCAESFYISVPWQTYCAKKCSSDSDCRFPELACLPTSDGTTACIPNFW